MSALIAVITVVYLCSLPETFHSLAHRKANAAEMLSHSREHIVKEGALFASLVHAADQPATAKLRQQLVDNEREFHDTASEVIAELPEIASDVEVMVGMFDHLSAAGWRAAAIAPQLPEDERRALLDGPFAKELDVLRAKTERVELSLQQRQDAAYPAQAHRPAEGTVGL